MRCLLILQIYTIKLYIRLLQQLRHKRYSVWGVKYIG